MTAPPMWRILAALVVCAALPIASYVTGSTIGAFRMFTDLTRYQLAIDVDTARGRQPFALERLSPHLGRDARRIILPAVRPVIGETSSELLAGGLGELGRLVCALERGSRSIELTLRRQRAEGSLPVLRRKVECPAEVALR